MSSQKNPKVVISGYYGFDNCGDEAVLLSIIHCLKELSPNVSITVLSGDPDKTRELYGVHAISRWNLLKIARKLLGANLLISGGGSLIQDVTSIRSPGYYLGVIKIALMLRKKVMIYAQGVGPLTDDENRMKTAKVFNRCHVITVRDNDSKKLLQELGVNSDIKVTCDPVLALSRDNADLDSVNDLLSKLGVRGDDGQKNKPLLFVSMRHWQDNRHIEPVAKLLDTQVAEGWDVLLVPAHFPDDVETCKLIRDKMETAPHVIEDCLTAKEFLALTAVSDRVFSMRLHGLICAIAVGTPMMGLSYDPKVDAFMNQCDRSEFCLAYDDADLQSKGADCLSRMPLPGSQNTLPFGGQFDERRLNFQKLAWSTANTAVNLIRKIRK